MGVSFKVRRVGTRYRPKPVQDEGQEDEHDVASVVDTQSRQRLNTGKFSGKGHKVIDHANKEGNRKSGMRLVSEDMKISFSLHLFPNGFSVGKANEHFNGLPKLLCPYSRASDALFAAIECGWLPGDFFGDIACNYNNGAVLCEIKDYRLCMYEKAGITSIVNSPVVHKVLLQMCMENVVKDILSVLDDSWTYKDLLEVESCLLKALQPDLHLNPEPLLDKFCGAPMRKKLDLGINWGCKKRKLNDDPTTNPKFSGQQPRSVPHSQPIITSCIPNLQNNNGLLESIIQPNALTGVPNYQSVDSCRSVLEDLTSLSLPSVPTPCFSKHNSSSREPSSLVFSQQGRCDAQAIQRLIFKVPKQETVDFSQQLPPWNQPSPLAMVPNYQLMDSCNQSAVGDLTSLSFSSVPTQCFSNHNWESREPSSLVCSPQGVGDELQAIQIPITKMPKQEPVDFSQQLPPWNQPSPLAMVPNYQLAASCGQSVVGDLTSSSLPSVPMLCFSNGDFKAPSSFGLSQLGSYPGSQPNMAMLPNYQLVNSCSQSVLGDPTSSNLSPVPLQCYRNSEPRDPSSLVRSQIGRCEMQAIQRSRFKIPKQETMDFSQQLPPPVNQPNPLAMVPNYQLVDSCNQSVLGDLTSSNLSSFPMQYFSKCNSESRDTSSFVHSQLGRPETQAAIQRPMMKMPKQETMDFTYRQPYPLAMLPNCQLAGGYSQSVVGDLTSSSLSSVPMQGFSKCNSGLVQSQLGRGEPRAIQSPITKMPKQEPVEFSQQQLPGSQPEFIFAAGMLQNAMLHQQPGAKIVPGERFNDKRGQSLLINSGQLAILEGIPKLHAGVSTSTMRQQPAETRNFSSLDVTRIKDKYIDMDTRSNQSNLQQVQMLGSSQMLGTYAPPINSPWNQLLNDRNVKKEVVNQKRKASQSTQVTAAVSISPLNSYHGESLQREASVPAKRKKNCRPRGLNSEVSDSLAVTGNTNAVVRSSLQFGNGYNTNASLTSSLLAGNGYNMDATIASHNTSLQAGNGYNTNATATATATASSLQAGNGYDTNASNLQSGNGYNTNVTIASSLQLGNCHPRVSNTEVSDSLAVTGNKNAPTASSLQVGNGYNVYTTIAGGLQAGNGYNANATIASSLHLENFNLLQTSEVDDIQRFEKIKEVTERHKLNNSKRKFDFDNRNSALVIFKLWNSGEIGKSKDVTTGIADERFDRTRTLTFMRRSHLHQGNEIPIVESKASVKLVMSNRKFTKGFVEGTIFYEHEEGIGPAVIHIPPTLPSMHFLDLFTAQFTSSMAREEYCLVSDCIEPVLLNGDNCSVDCLVGDCIEPVLLNDGNCSSTRNVDVTAGVPLVAIALGMISSSTPGLSTSMLSPVSDEVSAVNICGQLPSKNLNSASHLLPPINILSAQQNSGSHLLSCGNIQSAQQNSGRLPSKKLNSGSHLLPPGSIQSAQQNSGQLASKNLNSGSHMLPPGDVQSAQRNPGTNLSKLQLANAAAQMNLGQPHWQQILSNQAQLQFQMMQRQRQQDQLMQSMKMTGGLGASVGVSGTVNTGGRIQGGHQNSARGYFSNGMGTGSSSYSIPREGQIPSTSNVGQFSNINGSNIPSSSDSKQQLFGGISDNASAVLAGGFQFWNSSGMVQMQNPNIQDMAYLLSNQQILPQKQQQQQEMRSVVQQQTKTHKFVSNVSSQPNQVSSQRFYQRPQISPLQLNSGPLQMQLQMNRNIVLGSGSPQLSSHIPFRSNNVSSSKNLSGFSKTRER